MIDIVQSISDYLAKRRKPVKQEGDLIQLNGMSMADRTKEKFHITDGELIINNSHAVDPHTRVLKGVGRITKRPEEE